MKQQHGYSLLEVSIATAILTVVSLLSFIVIRSSAEATQVTSAKEDVQANLRDVMMAITTEVRQAYTERVLDGTAPDDVEIIRVIDDGRTLVFSVPVPTDTSPVPNASAPITIRHENEDLGEEPNAMLDGGEDANGDGALTRRAVRVQGNDERVLGASNAISDMRFALVENPSDDVDALTELQISLVATKRHGAGEGQVVRAELSSTISLQN